MKSSKRLVLLVSFLVLPVSLYGQSIAEENPATIIMERVIQKMLNNEMSKHKHLNFKKHYTVTDLDDLDKPKKITTDRVIQVMPPNGNEILVQEDGKAKNKKQSSGGEFEKIIEALSQRFHYEMAIPTSDCPTCPVLAKDGKTYLVINFKAIGNVKTDGDDIKEIMDRSTGQIYIDVENFYIQRFESRMARSYSRGFGIFQLKQANVVLEQDEIDTPIGKITVTMSTQIRYLYSLFGGESRGIRSWEYSEYRFVP